MQEGRRSTHPVSGGRAPAGTPGCRNHSSPACVACCKSTMSGPGCWWKWIFHIPVVSPSPCLPCLWLSPAASHLSLPPCQQPLLPTACIFPRTGLGQSTLIAGEQSWATCKSKSSIQQGCKHLLRHSQRLHRDALHSPGEEKHEGVQRTTHIAYINTTWATFYSPGLPLASEKTQEEVHHCRALLQLPTYVF